MTGPRDWDKELAKIDRLIAGGAGTGAEGGALSPRPGQRPPPQALGPEAKALGAKPSVLGVWLRVLLGGMLAAGMTQWPYTHGCGVPLLVYFGATGVVVLAGLWAAAASWRRRMGLAHILALVVSVWGLVLAAAVILPRTGYAAEAATWLCR